MQLKIYLKIKTTHLSPFLGNLFAIGIRVLRDGNTKPINLIHSASNIVANVDVLERELLDKFWGDISMYNMDNVTWVTYGQNFDLPFVIHRSMCLRQNTHGATCVPSIPEIVNNRYGRNSILRHNPDLTCEIKLKDLRSYTIPFGSCADGVTLPVVANAMGIPLEQTNATAYEKYLQLAGSHDYDRDLPQQPEEFINNTLENELVMMSTLDEFYG